MPSHLAAEANLFIWRLKEIFYSYKIEIYDCCNENLQLFVWFLCKSRLRCLDFCVNRDLGKSRLSNTDVEKAFQHGYGNRDMLSGMGMKIGFLTRAWKKASRHSICTGFQHGHGNRLSDTDMKTCFTIQAWK